MFTDAELTTVAKLCQHLAKSASWVNPMASNNYTLNMPPIKSWEQPPETLGDAAKHVFTGLGGMAGTTAQTLFTGRNNKGVLENYLSHGIKFMSHPTDPQRFRDLISFKNITQPFQRAQGEYGQAFRETGELGARVIPELGERYRILKGVFNGPGGTN